MQALVLARKSTLELLKHIEWLVANHSKNGSAPNGLAKDVQAGGSEIRAVRAG